MLTDEERVKLLHKRAKLLSIRRDRIVLTLLGTAGAVLLSVILAIGLLFAGAGHSASGSQMTGSSMLSESAGGYVLVAVIAFAAAVVITVICIRWKQRNSGKAGHMSQKNREDDDKEDIRK